jgi:TolB-like protein/DNA-binding winged helix-turn-helix (wHTH) protein
VEPTNGSGVIAFDDIEIDITGRRLIVGGKDIALEPKAFAVLALLAGNPGKALARDDILDVVWGHRHVTQNVLHRAITMLRQALGGNVQQRQYIHTVHGVGYRFDAELRQASSPAATSVAKADATTAATEPAAADGAHAWTTRVRRNRLAMIALALLAAVVFMQRRKSPPPASPTLVVLPLHVIDEDKSESAFADGLSEELTMRLARIEGLRLISSTSATRAQHDGFDAMQLAERLHVTHALEGSLREAGDQLRIDLRLIETPSGRTLWAQGYDRKLADVFALQQDIAQAVASAMTLPIGLTHSTTPTPDPLVFREYLQLRHIFLTQADDAVYTKAEADLDALAARAPDFAPVHGLLALNLASDFEGEGRENDALREARHTLALDPNDVYAHATLGMLAQKNRDWATAKKQFDIALALSPSDAVMHNITGMWLGRLGYGDLAVEQEQIAYASDPLGYWVVYNLGVQLDVTGQHDAARRYLDKLPGLENAPIALTVDAR